MRRACASLSASRWKRMGSAMMSSTRMRGFSEEYGSWKIIWIWRRKGLSCFSPLSAVRSVPPKCTDPADGVYSPEISRATVDLPEPDSPTRPKTSPSPMAKPTFLTASSVRWLRFRNAFLSTKRMPRPRTSTNGPSPRPPKSRRWPSQWVAMSSGCAGVFTSSM